MGMEVQGLAIPAFGTQMAATVSSRELRRRSRARHPHFNVARARGFDAPSTLTAMDIEGIDVAVMYGTRGRQILCHDNLSPDYAAALARAYNNWAADYCKADPVRLKFAAQIAMHDVFTSATTGGARALRRDDLGRITPGAKSDFVMVDITHPTMQPLYDPIRSLVYAAGERAIRHVFVGGQQVVRDGKALAFDYADASARLEMAQRRAIEKVPGLDRAGRSAAEIMPPTFPSR
jgi:hypothetical protein